MKTLTDEGCCDWLASHKLLPNPYYAPNPRPPFCEQFPLPKHAPSSSAMFRSIVTCVEPFDTALLHITDWSLYEPDEMAVVSHVRQAFGEHRSLIETPGHVFAGVERDLLIGLIALVTSYGWTAYVYFDHGVTFLSWEGDLLDLFVTDRAHYKAVCELLQHMGISSSACA